MCFNLLSNRNNVSSSVTKELVSRLQAGDGAAMQTLLDAYKPQIRLYASKILYDGNGNVVTVVDADRIAVLQETLIEAFMKCDLSKFTGKRAKNKRTGKGKRNSRYFGKA